MSLGTQGSLFSEQSAQPTLGDLSTSISRRPLTDGAWVDLCPGWISGADELFDRLREWRRLRAQTDGVPAYVVFHDATLGAIAEERPTNRVALATISGIGPAKLERYADEVLEVVASDPT